MTDFASLAKNTIKLYENMIDDGALENYTDGSLISNKERVANYEIVIHKLKKPVISQQKLMSIIRNDGKIQEEIFPDMIDSKHRKVIDDICNILYEHRSIVSKLNLILKK